MRFNATGVVANVTKYSELSHYGGVDNWYADMPDEEWERWMGQDSTVNAGQYEASGDTACLKFSHLDEGDNVLADMESCHNPRLLPAAGTQPYNFTMCFSTLLMPDEEHDGLHAGYRHLLPSIGYHSRHGVDQFVFYISTKNRQATVDLLAGPIADGLVTLILLDSSLEKVDSYNVKIDSYNVKINSQVLTQEWFENDCMNRYKGHTKLMRTMDYDELMYPTAWRDTAKNATLDGLSMVDTLSAFLDDTQADYVYARGYNWELVEDQTLLHAKIRTAKMPGRFFKSIFKPDHLALTWVHIPTNCFDQECKKYSQDLVEYAHYRLARDPKTTSLKKAEDPHAKDNEEFVADTMFVDKAVKVDLLVCRWRPQDCSVAPDTNAWVPGRLKTS